VAADPAPACLDDPPVPLDDFGGAASTTRRRNFDPAPVAAADLGGPMLLVPPLSLCVYMYVCVYLYVCTAARSSFPSSGGGKSRQEWRAVGVACGGGGVVPLRLPSLPLCVACSCGYVRWWWCWGVGACCGGGVGAGGRGGGGGAGWWMAAAAAAAAVLGGPGRQRWGLGWRWGGGRPFFCFIKNSSPRARWASRRMSAERVPGCSR
jgi:hypothetical protein